MGVDIVDVILNCLSPLTPTLSPRRGSKSIGTMQSMNILQKFNNTTLLALSSGRGLGEGYS